MSKASESKLNRKVPALVELIIGIALVSLSRNVIGGLAGYILEIIGDLLIFFSIVGFFRWLISKPRNTSMNGGIGQDPTIEDMASLTLQNIQSKYGNASLANKELFEDIDRKGVIFMMQLAENSPNDLYAPWLHKETRAALRTKDSDRIVLMSTISSCLSAVTKNGIPSVFENMSDCQCFFVLYGAILSQIGEQMLTNYEG